MSRARNWEGQRIGKLTVLAKTEKRSKNGHVVFACVCDCGNAVERSSYYLHRVAAGMFGGQCTTCGEAVKHGHTVGHKKSPTYVSWRSMMRRCLNHRNKDFKYYGGRGIRVTDEWQGAKRLRHIPEKDKRTPFEENA